MTIVRRIIPLVLAATILAGCSRKPRDPDPVPTPVVTATPTPAPTATPYSFTSSSVICLLVMPKALKSSHIR